MGPYGYRHPLKKRGSKGLSEKIMLPRPPPRIAPPAYPAMPCSNTSKRSNYIICTHFILIAELEYRCGEETSQCFNGDESDAS